MKRQEHNDVAGFIFATIGVFYAVLLAFVVIVGWEALTSARNTTYTEADQLANVYWISRYLPSPQGAAIEGLTLKYAHTVIEVISAISFDVAVLEMGEDECGAGNVADLAGAGGDVLESAPALGE
jgi:hypothetical protein